MGWLVSIAVGVVTAIVGTVGAALLAGLLVDWYNVSSFEGGSGFFVIGIALLGLIGGFVVGIAAARVVAVRPAPGFLKAVGASCGAVAAILAIGGGAARLLADVPPTIDGDTLFLNVEVRWPAGSPDPRSLPGAGYVRLGTSSGRVVRRIERGPLFLQDARVEDGRWIAPGAVDVFTSRGERILELQIGETSLGGFVVPLPRHPGAAERQWSEWLPHDRDGRPAPADQLTYRFRVVRQSEPIRVERAGAFEIAAVVRYFYDVDTVDRMAAHAVFSIAYKGQTLPGFTQVESAALVAAPRTTLLVQTEEPVEGGVCHLLIDAGDRADVRTIAGCASPIQPLVLTSDAAIFRASAAAKPLPGELDRSTLVRPGLYVTGSTVIDTRTNAFWTIGAALDPQPISSVPPLALSPDEHSFVRFAHDGCEENPVLVVVDFRADRSAVVPIDRARMRYGKYESIDPAWIAHHFEWAPGPESSRLAPRAAFSPLPHAGELEIGGATGNHTYTIRPGRERLRAAVMEILMSLPGAERLPDELGGYRQRVRLDGQIVNVSVIEDGRYVYASTDVGVDAALIKTVAARLDAAFASGKYDSAFETGRVEPAEGGRPCGR